MEAFNTKEAIGNNVSFTILRNSLFKALNRAQSIAKKKSMVPILSNIMIIAKDDQIECIATNMDISWKEKLDAQIEHQGSISINAHLFCEIVRRLPNDKVISIKQKGEVCVINSNSAVFELSTLATEQFPSIKTESSENVIKMSAKQFNNIFNKVQFAVAGDDLRHYLSGINVEINGNKIIAAATDGHRLACTEAETNNESEKQINTIIPKRAITEILRIIKEEDKDIEIAFLDSKIQFKCNRTTIISKIIDGSFPNYRKVIPEIIDSNKVSVNLEHFRESIDRISLISSEKTRGIKMKFTTDMLELNANSTESGKAAESLPIQYTGQDIEIGFNAKYLLDVLSNIEQENIEMIITSPISPVRIIDASTSSTVYVIMPMRL